MIKEFQTDFFSFGKKRPPLEKKLLRKPPLKGKTCSKKENSVILL